MSEQAIGRFNINASWVFYIGLAALYALLFLLFYFGVGITSLAKRGIIIAIIFIVVYVVGFYLGFLVLNGRLQTIQSIVVIGLGVGGATFFSSWMLISRQEALEEERRRKKGISSI
jgi:hypothetical protein